MPEKKVALSFAAEYLEETDIFERVLESGTSLEAHSGVLDGVQ